MRMDQSYLVKTVLEADKTGKKGKVDVKKAGKVE